MREGLWLIVFGFFYLILNTYFYLMSPAPFIPITFFFLMMIITGIFDLKECYNRNLYLSIMILFSALMWIVSYIEVLSLSADKLIYVATAFLTVIIIVFIRYSLKAWEEFEKALEPYNKSLEINPNDITALNNKGVELTGQRKYEKAIKCFDKALEIDPEDIAVLHNKDFMKKYIPYRTVADKLEKKPKLEFTEKTGKLFLEIKK